MIAFDVMRQSIIKYKLLPNNDLRPWYFDIFIDEG